VAKRSYDDILTKTITWKKGTWYHIAVTFDGTSFKIYVNGELEKKVRHAGEHASDSRVCFGAKRGAKSAFDGKLDDIRIYSYALTQEEVAALYKAGCPALTEKTYTDVQQTERETKDVNISSKD